MRISRKTSGTVLQAAAYRGLLWCTEHTAGNIAMYSSDKKEDVGCFDPVKIPVDNRRIPIHICGY